MKLTCYIIDDETDALELLKEYAEGTPGLELLGYSQDPLKALDAITGSGAPDITFLDVDMRQLTGIEFAGMINLYTSVIFTTAYPQYALQAFEKEAYDYLMKPISYARFIDSVTRYDKHLLHHRRAKDIHDFFNVKSEHKGRMVRISTREVIYIESKQNYIRIVTASGEHTTYLTMNEIEVELPHYFYRVHRSFLINSHFARFVERNRVILDGEAKIPMGDSYKQPFLDAMDAGLIRTKRLL